MGSACPQHLLCTTHKVLYLTRCEWYSHAVLTSLGLAQGMVVHAVSI